MDKVQQTQMIRLGVSNFAYSRCHIFIIRELKIWQLWSNMVVIVKRQIHTNWTLNVFCYTKNSCISVVTDELNNKISEEIFQRIVSFNRRCTDFFIQTKRLKTKNKSNLSKSKDLNCFQSSSENFVIHLSLKRGFLVVFWSLSNRTQRAWKVYRNKTYLYEHIYVDLFSCVEQFKSLSTCRTVEIKILLFIPTRILLK